MERQRDNYSFGSYIRTQEQVEDLFYESFPPEIQICVHEQIAQGFDFLCRYEHVDGVRGGFAFWNLMLLETSRPELYQVALHSLVAANISEVLFPSVAGVFHSQRQVNVDCYAACLMHDIGKAALPSEAITKAQAQKNNRLYLYQTHPELGARITASFFPDYVNSAIKYHHVKFDGSGFPEKRDNYAYSYFVQLIALADNLANARMQEINGGGGAGYEQIANKFLYGMLPNFLRPAYENYLTKIGI